MGDALNKKIESSNYDIRECMTMNDNSTTPLKRNRNNRGRSSKKHRLKPSKQKSMKPKHRIKREILEEFEAMMVDKHEKSLKEFKALVSLSILLYSNILIVVSMISLSFIGSLSFGGYLATLRLVFIVTFSIYAIRMASHGIKLFLKKVMEDVEYVDTFIAWHQTPLPEYYSENILKNQFKQIGYITPLALAWLALIGLKM